MRSIFLAAFGAAFGLCAQSADLQGKMFEKGSNHQKLMYNYARHEETLPDGSTKFTAHFTDPSGRSASDEELVTAGDAFKTYNVSQNDVQESGGIEIKNGKLLFTYKSNGKTRTSEEDLPENFIVGPIIFTFVKAHWGDLLAGKTVKSRLGVVDRRETVGFEFMKIGESKLNGQDVVRIKMKPTSFLISALVDPIFFTADKAGGRVFMTEGTTLVREKVGREVKNISGEMLFD